MKKGKKVKDMYLFDAKYINIDNEDEESIIIEVDTQMVKYEKEAYLTAMSMAYDMQTESISLQALVLIGIER